MELEEIGALREMLPAGRTLFTYAKHQYGLQLLRYAAPRPTPVAALRQTPAAPLLQKPQVKAALAQCGNKISRAFLDAHIGCLPGIEHYALGIDVWAPAGNRRRAIQTSRPGANLVLQINFSHQHNRAFERLLQPEPSWDFNNGFHPVLHGEAAGRRHTLAWARLDIDFDHGEALIEEIQTDWLRLARKYYEHARSGSTSRLLSRWRDHMRAPENFAEYYETCLARHAAHWDEATLAAALFFLREELGLPEIWMHTPQSGLLLKEMDAKYAAPPASLYSDLPQRFCFRATESLPGFLAQDKSVVRRLRRAPGVRLQKFML
jgi:hypothetical protein